MEKDIKYQGNPAMFRNSPFGFLIALALCAVGVGILILLYWYLKTKATKFTITNEDVEVERGLLSKDRIDISIKNIRTTKVTQTFGQRLFGVGDIQIFTAGDNPEATLEGLKDAQKIRDLLKS
jgi:uncharacterized membrane protein YdbT with pleckstrin-like domain